MRAKSRPEQEEGLEFRLICQEPVPSTDLGGCLFSVESS